MGAELTHLGLLSPVSIHAHRRLCPFMFVIACPFMGAGRRSWPMVALWLVVVRMHCGSWVMKGAGGHRRLCAVVVVVVACVPSWVLGISCGRWWLVVVVLGWGGGGCFWVVVVVFHGWSASSRSNESLERVLACDVACHVIVVVVGGGCEQMAMVVGGGGCWRRW